ncbi:MAG: DUF433 domain-containing protein [Bacteroidetes bacterium]|nr:DUF433 domain-containing protein [Bacteroidota bacterium]
MPHERITIDPDVMFGKPVIRGTRVPVEHILRKLAAGESVQAVLAAFPHLVENDVRAALAFAADTIALDDIELAPGEVS